MGDPTTCVYQLVLDENENNDTHIIQYYIMNGLRLCIRVDNYVAHMFYVCSFSHNTAFRMAIKKNT